MFWKKYGDGDDMYEGRNLSNIAKKIIKENKSTPLMLNGKEVDEKSIEIDGVDRRDYPDFSDAYISAANYIDGTPLSDKEIEELDDQNNELVHEKFKTINCICKKVKKKNLVVLHMIEKTKKKEDNTQTNQRWLVLHSSMFRLVKNQLLHNMV